jgi:hypothetical protein
MSNNVNSPQEAANELTPEQMKMHLSMVKAITDQMMPWLLNKFAECEDKEAYDYVDRCDIALRRFL